MGLKKFWKEKFYFKYYYFFFSTVYSTEKGAFKVEYKYEAVRIYREKGKLDLINGIIKKLL